MSRVLGWALGAPYCAAYDGAMMELAAVRSSIDPKPFLDIWMAHGITNVHKLIVLGLLATNQPVVLLLP